MVALELDELVEAEPAQRRALARVLPPGPREVLERCRQYACFGARGDRVIPGFAGRKQALTQLG